MSVLFRLRPPTSCILKHMKGDGYTSMPNVELIEGLIILQIGKPIILTHCSGLLCCLFQSVHRLENVVGWYHSHPGYGCWLSGIDCSTQMLNQQYQVVASPYANVLGHAQNDSAFQLLLTPASVVHMKCRTAEKWVSDVRT